MYKRQVIGFVTYISFILTATLMASMIFIMLPRAEVSVTRIEEILNSESEIQDREDAFLPEQFLSLIHIYYFGEIIICVCRQKFIEHTVRNRHALLII